jgi:peptide deformylase
MELQLVQPNHPALHSVANTNVFEADIDVQEYEQAMLKLMAGRFGIGLASNQVGNTYNMFVMMHSEHGDIGVYNPEIVSVSEKSIAREEGCLSFPLLFMNITRPESITVRYTKSDGKTVVEEELHGTDAQCFHHEWEHLNGLLFIHGASDMKLQRAMKKREKTIKKLQSQVGTQ